MSGSDISADCGGTIAAASFNFVYEKRLQAYLTAYDPRYERASPGTILMVHYIKWAFDSGLHYVDFLRGDEPFKYRFANTVTPLEWLHWCTDTGWPRAVGSASLVF